MRERKTILVGHRHGRSWEQVRARFLVDEPTVVALPLGSVGPFQWSKEELEAARVDLPVREIAIAHKVLGPGAVFDHQRAKVR
jgi:hypothetical protein